MRFVLLVAVAAVIAALSAAYQYVAREIASGGPRIALTQSPPVVLAPVDMSKLGLGSIDLKEIKRFQAQGFANQVNETTRRMQDISAYMRTPPGRWHGPPPH